VNFFCLAVLSLFSLSLTFASFTTICLGVGLLALIKFGDLLARREWNDIFKNLKDKNLQPRILYPAKISFKYDGEIKTFPDKQKLREFIVTKPPLQEILRKTLIPEKSKKGKGLQNQE
uniref:L1 transposable element dsRBD-like domain-containing protein n=1 Tax=Equus caballus TaxID=9796 RepID=A0A9L0RRQ7_HORSE